MNQVVSGAVVMISVVIIALGTAAVPISLLSPMFRDELSGASLAGSR